MRCASSRTTRISTWRRRWSLIRRVAPREAYLTHMSHDIGRQAATEATLPPHVHMAYDTPGWRSEPSDVPAAEGKT